MLAFRMLARTFKNGCLSARFQLSSSFSELSSVQRQYLLPVIFNNSSQQINLVKIVPSQVSLLRNFHFDSHQFHCRLFSSVSTESSANDVGSSNSESPDVNKDENQSEGSKEPDSESNDDRSPDDLVKLLDEKEGLLKAKHKEIEAMQDKVLRAYAEMENVMDRTKREAENSKKFAIQAFAKSLLDVADNLGRASVVVKESFSKLDVTNDSAGAASLLKTLLEGVEMTEKQLIEVFKKFGVEKYDPTNEPFDPHRHNAVFQVPDSSKPPGTVAAVLKVGYTLYDRVIRPAEVGVTQFNDDADPKE